MICRPLVRMLLAPVVAAAVIALAGCNTAEEYLSKSSLRAQQPLSPKMLAELDKKNMDKGSPILVRVFKEESELEVWKKTRDGRYALLKTYPICRWSGALGPKVKEGDRQAPEGFYEITPGQMNPNSNYYLAFNTGFPNAYDRAWGHTGSDLMVHGDCSSRGCYAMTDEQIGEIYALARDSFFGGQRAFQFEAFPFRMTALNMARHRNNPNMPFWKMLKVGYDHFEVTHLEPKVNVCERHYVFDAAAAGGSSRTVNFTPTGKCPSYQVSPEIAAAVAEKEHQDDIQEAALISQGTPTVPVKTGVDGGMNSVFLAALTRHEQVEVAQGDTMPAPTPTPTGTIPALVNPPHVTQVAYGDETSAPASGAPVLAAVSAKSHAPRAQARPTAVARKEKAPERVRTAARKEPAAKEPAQQHVAALPKPRAIPAAHGAPRLPQLRGSTTAVAKAGKSSPARPSTMDSLMHPGLPATATAMAAPTRAMRGAQPVLQTGSFESRWSALR